MSTRYITARRVAGDLYDVTYSDGSETGRMSWRGVEHSATRGGYSQIHIDRSEQRGEGESALEIVRVPDVDADGRVEG